MADTSKKVKFMCSFGGKFLPRPSDSALRYVGGHNRIVSMSADIPFPDFMLKMSEAHGGGSVIVKYQLPGEDFDSLISVLGPEDLHNMMEEQRCLPADAKYLRLFLFVPMELGLPSDLSELLNQWDITEARSSPEASSPVLPNPQQTCVDPTSPQSGVQDSPVSLVPVFMVPTVAALPEAQLGVGGVPVGVTMIPADAGIGTGVNPNPELGIEGASVALLPAAPQTQYLPVMPAPAPPETQIVGVVPLQPSPEESSYVERRFVHVPSAPEFVVAMPPSVQAASVEISTALPPRQGPQLGQVMKLGECVMCNKGLPHAHSDTLLQESGFGSSTSPGNVAFNSLQPQDVMPAQVSPKAVLGTGMYGAVQRSAVPQPDAMGYIQKPEVGSFQRGLESSRIAAAGEELNQIGGVPSPTAQCFPCDILLSGGGDLMGSQGVKQLLPQQYPIVQESVVNKQTIGYPALAKSGMSGRKISDDPPRSVHYNINLPVTAEVLPYANPPDLLRVGEQQKEDANPHSVMLPVDQSSVYPESVRSGNVLNEEENSEDEKKQTAEEEIFLGKNFIKHGTPREGISKNAVGNVSPYPFSIEVGAPSPNYYTAGFTTSISSGEPPVGVLKEQDFLISDAPVLTNDAEVGAQDSGPCSSLFSASNHWRIMHTADKPPQVPKRVAGQSLLPKDLLVDTPSENDGNELHSASQKDHDNNKLSDFFKRDLNPDNGQAMTGQEFKQDVEAVDEKMPSHAPQSHDAPTMEINKLRLGAQMTDGFERLQTIKNKDLEELRELGSGTFGTVYYGKWKGTDVAIKRIYDRCFVGRPSEQERQRSEFWNEACILAELRHPNIVRFYGVVLDGPGGSVATVTEYMANGSLRNALQKKKVLDRHKLLLIAMDTAFGMEYLHGKSIVHFDLKSDNLLLNLRDRVRPICKVADLGLSKVKCKTLISGGVRGTLPWMAPELLNGSSSLVSEKVDVYSFGIVLWELLTGEEPYGNMHYGALIGGILNNTLRPPIPESCDPDWRSLMERCWASDPSERPSFTEIAAKLRSMVASSSEKSKPQTGCASPSKHKN